MTIRTCYSIVYYDEVGEEKERLCFTYEGARESAHEYSIQYGEAMIISPFGWYERFANGKLVEEN